MPEQRILFGDSPQLEGRWLMPREARGVVVFSHPHPQMGGDMDNNLVRLACHELNRLGFATLRFNFRGVGQSEGRFDNGDGETDDVLTAVDEARHRTDHQLPLILAGYSFGSWTTWKALDRIDPLPIRIVLVSPPCDMPEFTYVPRPGLNSSVQILLGEQDAFCGTAGNGSWHAELAPACSVLRFDTDHFWIGIEQEAAQAIAETSG